MSLFVVDASVTATREIDALYMGVRERPHVVVLNKADLPAAIDREQWLERYGEARIVEASAVTGKGRDALEDALVEAVRGGEIDLSTMRFHLAGRQREFFKRRLRPWLARAARLPPRRETRSWPWNCARRSRRSGGSRERTTWAIYSTRYSAGSAWGSERSPDESGKTAV